MIDLPHTIDGVITAFDGDKAHVSLENDQVVTLPKDRIPEAATVGSSVHLAVFSSNDVASEHERLAKAVLKELLRSE